ncbi:NADH dehydrogenase [ubiquinone] 1 alpha subcomplex subunit 5 [Zootermopsis nevadensis]|uniref:NADH dehydrogenase [ubiquinone] 1 alpha subcomplex subunit 5 n=1 Tax=Zootermopsis nevadensis TaxID=136037 RepID=A0A067RC26_ZOONE|nr:NADH dehydrogenase [ubiquinone] 1 alpha subcomplex subunit 5 [Zootermopsis nevadensis]XP_021923915.1 NADH dehydrogenase [ubiquinone] 1 alpha subcomplex subunit 5 [Zootermopsis nevadensis]KDR17347.1 NADH dehydrogenase [ubiquinone] 1 alpha subcomplex subunit 5 [Zootermopsis nevadensis]
MASGVLKQTTGLTGLAVVANPHHLLSVLYGKILRTIQKMPSSAAYRNYTEEIIKVRAEIVKNTSDVKELERKIGCGQAEELIQQAENELVLARKMLTWKPWEPLITKPLPNQWAWPCTK